MHKEEVYRMQALWPMGRPMCRPRGRLSLVSLCPTLFALPLFSSAPQKGDMAMDEAYVSSFGERERRTRDDSQCRVAAPERQLMIAADSVVCREPPPGRDCRAPRLARPFAVPPALPAGLTDVCLGPLSLNRSLSGESCWRVHGALAQGRHHPAPVGCCEPRCEGVRRSTPQRPRTQRGPGARSGQAAQGLCA